MKKEILILLILGANVSALQNINITVDSKDAEICLTSNFRNHTCNINQKITLDGTQDHFLYFVPVKAVGAGVNQTQIIQSVFTDTIQALFSGGILALFFVLTIFTPFALKWILGNRFL